MKTKSIFPTVTFSNAAEYVEQYRNTDTSLAWDSIGIADWSGLCRILEIDAMELTGGKHRRAIDAAYKLIQANANGGALKPNPINTRVPANAPVEHTPNLPEPVAIPVQSEKPANKANDLLERAKANLLSKRKGEEAPATQPEKDINAFEAKAPQPIIEPIQQEKVNQAIAEIEAAEEQKAKDDAIKAEKLKPAAPKAPKAKPSTQPEAAPVMAPEVVNHPANSVKPEPKTTKEKLLELLAEVEQAEQRGAGVDEEAVRKIAQEEISNFEDTLKIRARFEGIYTDIKDVWKELKSATVKTTEISVNGVPAVNVGLTHFKFEKLLRAAAARVHQFWVGEAGAGKSHTAAQIAEALGLPFHETPVCNQTSKTDLLGYTSITTGQVIRTEFREAYENGGVFLLDEMDKGNANVLSVINSALSNGRCAFPDGIVKQNPDFILIGAGNTYGNGANRQYVGSNQIDAATLNRFVIEEYPYDEDLEMAIAGNPTFTAYVQAVRQELQGERVIVSPRASINGAKLLAAGWDLLDVIESVIISGWPQNLRDRALGVKYDGHALV